MSLLTVASAVNPTTNLWDSGSAPTVYPAITALNNSTSSTATSVAIGNTAVVVVSSTASFTFVPGGVYRATVPVGGIINSVSAATGITFKIIPPGAALTSGSPSWIEGGVAATATNQYYGGNFVEIFTAVDATGALRLVASTTTSAATGTIAATINTSSETLVIERLA
jgi:hypothetical protein